MGVADRLCKNLGNSINRIRCYLEKGVEREEYGMTPRVLAITALL
jgi:hypothetical protein